MKKFPTLDWEKLDKRTRVRNKKQDRLANAPGTTLWHNKRESIKESRMAT